jgi:hypothetical protein
MRVFAICGYLFLALGMVVVAERSARAQATTGTFTGAVTDPTGAVVPNATVTVTNEATNVSASRTTGTEGLYTIPNLLPGFYTLQAAASGFKSLVNQHVELTVGYTQKVDFKLEVGQTTQAVTVEGQAPLVSTEEDTMSQLVTARQVQNLPLNGRNVFQLIQLAPGAVNTTNLITEPGNRGFTTVVNGARVNMNGYSLDGITDKGLSGGSNTQPSVDTIQEFRVETENISAEYGSTVGANTFLVTKSGTNQFHGTAYEFLRNTDLDARNFFEYNKTTPTGEELPGTARSQFNMNQFGGTIGGPIKKNKLFFFGSYEGERTRIGNPQIVVTESPQFRSLVQSAAPNSVAALLYKNFPAPAGNSSTPCNGTSINISCYIPLSTYVTSLSGQCDTFNAACLSSAYGLSANNPLTTALLNNPNMPMQQEIAASAEQESGNQFYNGNQAFGRIDWNGEKDKIFGSFFYDHYEDPLYSPGTNGGNPAADVALRGFTTPITYNYPHLALGWTRSISPTTLNEFRAGWSQAVNPEVSVNNAGVPQISPDTLEVNFGGYNGYPQFFHEEVFSFSDIVTMTRGKHTLKWGGNLARNYENSEFNVGRPSYAFVDSVALAAGFVESESAGVEPGSVDVTTGTSTGQAHLASNIRGWRNWEFGLFFNDTYKVTPRLTLNLGLRWDLYTPHTDKYGHVTQFVLPSGANETVALHSVNCFEDIAGATGFNGQPCNGGFAAKNGSLAPTDYNNFGPRVGFAWDVKGDGKTAIRGGFGVAYQGEIYNPLSNSRWNPPYYSFNSSACGDGTNVYGPGINSCIFGPVDGSAPTYTGPPTNIGHGPAGATANAFGGNISGWNPYNSNAAILTGIVFNDFRTPYVYGAQLTGEHQFSGNWVVRTSWIGTFGHKLYRAEDINRAFGGRNLPGAGAGTPFPNGVCTSSRGPYRPNCLYGRLRVWENSVNSNYNAWQTVVDKRMSHGVEMNASYVWSHSLDTRSTWHSGATTANGAAEGFSMDQALPNLDYGNSIFDSTNRFTLSFVWQLPWYSGQQGLAGHLLGGWQVNGAWSLHGGFPWTPYCSGSSSPKGCDFNLDGVSNDRPNQPAFGNSWTNVNTAFEGGHPTQNLTAGAFYCGADNPLAGCTPSVSSTSTPFNGNLGRNTFRGPRYDEFDFSLFKNIKASERINFQFRFEAFNLANHTNLQQPSQAMNANSQFGLATAAYFPRQIQFALKMIF